MAFFEELGKKITDAGQNVAQTTKNFTDVSHLNSEISEKEKQIARLYESIGQSYYERHKNDDNAEELEKIRQINELNEEIFQKQEQIKQIKGVEKCAGCGADVPLEAMFCSVCGMKVERFPASEASQLVCTSCHEVIPAEATFCPMCGAKVEAPAEMPPERRCPSCGNIVPDEDIFCNYCGTKMGSA